jgi:hypothetical protein
VLIDPISRTIRLVGPHAQGQENHMIARVHGHARRGIRTPEYDAWRSLRGRCENPNHKLFASNGALGYYVDERWRRDFAQFLTDVGPRPSAAYELGRMDSRKPYVKGNVIWKPAKRARRFISFAGECLPVAAWSARTGIPVKTIESRLRAWKNVEEVLTRPIAYKTPSTASAGARAMSRTWSAPS